jgi:hypothetical protein
MGRPVAEAASRLCSWDAPRDGEVNRDRRVKRRVRPLTPAVSVPAHRGWRAGTDTAGVDQIVVRALGALKKNQPRGLT